ncbi:uncharacterized protein LOC105799301 [Gossypium raimondii]|uniref:Uncharacterized protein n=1 Tax=Gossypium raimondii TaxID=29730 RepID=A0A0D2SW62_GOSRA|nr:uncharacterized protein LOC105799301 [Gossypium raimondii]KJB35550.1 hypothetical protein B456_006G119700 [Gossypium raimondii]MBA0587669.1 hypothetical protein [Gossypium raimondii]
MKSYSILVVLVIVLLSTEAAIVHGQGKGNNGNGNNNGNGYGNSNSNGKGKGNSNGKGKGDSDDGKGKNKGNGDKKKNKKDDDEVNYDMSSSGTGQERAYCKGKSACYQKTLVCPSECPQRKPTKNKKQKACHINCGSKCEATCKWRKPKCDGYGSLCYDPRFVGGDGVMFYFHGAKGGNFAIVSDDQLQINAHFIGTRPQGRTRDFTWVQALAVMFDTHTLVIAANRVSHWDDNVDALSVRWDDETVTIPYDGEGEWRKGNGDERQVLVERTDDKNSLHVKISGLVEMDIRVRPIGKEENKVHNYQLPDDDAFAHLETQFKFTNLSDEVEGVLGKTYQPDYVSPVKRGVAMPMMGGEDKYQTPSLFSPFCKACRFQRPSGSVATI